MNTIRNMGMITTNMIIHASVATILTKKMVHAVADVKKIKRSAGTCCGAEREEKEDAGVCMVCTVRATNTKSIPINKMGVFCFGM